MGKDRGPVVSSKMMRELRRASSLRCLGRSVWWRVAFRCSHKLQANAWSAWRNLRVHVCDVRCGVLVCGSIAMYCFQVLEGRPSKRAFQPIVSWLDSTARNEGVHVGLLGKDERQVCKRERMALRRSSGVAMLYSVVLRTSICWFQTSVAAGA